ncbi:MULTISPECIES: tyrosine-type recombinase/integrase [unclassified Sphingomonas]|uniref:tyrosine-type recombinase/integrase n=1 Tax=unclassified Sphingomonas TaxID=196159 RepID=UPI000700A1DB|nr:MULTISPECIES: site-specific integrase [unclassified Sphingomonas]KQX19150.1 integrase [Sphingomonas sp. Root1294]KQY65351.1 integrase [Sphingomonas sp. Root50]KRB95356.1 integrase [Sphingomonas sp. Root720]
MSNIVVCERREAEGLDAHIPLILRDGVLYDPDLDRFFLDLPLDGVRSRHSLRAYAYDVAVWLRFLDASDKTIWAATRDDVTAYHRARRRGEADHRITAASWNRSVACLDRLYRWGEQCGLIADAPFSRRAVWRPTQGGRRGVIAARNDAYERAARRSDVQFVMLDQYRVFRDVGLQGLRPDGTARPGARDRNGLRNALFADLLVTTGLRLEEASGLAAAELAAIGQSDDQSRQVWLPLPPPLTKGDRGRSVLIPRRLLQQIIAYMAVERASAVAKFVARGGIDRVARPIPVPRSGLGRMLEICTPEERGRLILCGEDGTPQEPVALWLTEVGQSMRPNSWEAIFARACQRCATSGFPLWISPHQLRHSFAVHMLALLIQQRLREAALPAGPIEGYRLILGDPLQQVQRLLGHASLATTYIYLDHIATRADTVDAAVEELLALLPGTLGA